MLGILRRVFSFRDWTARHPMEPPPGDMLDASFDAQNQKISELEDTIATLRRSDGQLRNGLVTADSVHPSFKDLLTRELAAKLRKTVEGVDSRASEAISARHKAEIASKAAEIAAERAKSAENAAENAQNSVLGPVSRLTRRAEIVAGEYQRLDAGLREIQAFAEDGAGESEAWAATSRLWAEHMPNTIPESALAETDVSGDHWSSRWWANYASQIVAEGLGLPGPAGPPGPVGGVGTTGDTMPLNPAPGALHWNSNTGSLYIWYEDVDSGQWVQIAPGGGGSGSGGGGSMSLDTASGTTIDTGETFRLIMLSTGAVHAIPYGAVAPAVPTGLAAIVRLTSVNLNWTPVSGATSYVVKRNGVQVGTTGAPSYRDSAITLGNTYSYTVSSVDQYQQRSPASSSVSAFIDPALNVAPSDVVVTCWPNPIPTDGPAIIRVNARDINVQIIAFTLGVDAGSLSPTADPSVWEFRI